MHGCDSTHWITIYIFRGRVGNLNKYHTSRTLIQKQLCSSPGHNGVASFQNAMHDQCFHDSDDIFLIYRWRDVIISETHRYRLFSSWHNWSTLLYSMANASCWARYILLSFNWMLTRTNVFCAGCIQHHWNYKPKFVESCIFLLVYSISTLCFSYIVLEKPLFLYWKCLKYCCKHG